MKNGYADEITKRELKKMGFIDVVWDENINDWVMWRYWYKNNSKTKYPHPIYPKIQVNKLKNGNQKEYSKFVWSYQSITYSTTASRVAKAWYGNKVIKGKVIDHRNNHSRDNSLENLRNKSIKANNRKRFKDNPGHTCFNQYQNTRTNNNE